MFPTCAGRGRPPRPAPWTPRSIHTLLHVPFVVLECSHIFSGPLPSLCLAGKAFKVRAYPEDRERQDGALEAPPRAAAAELVCLSGTGPRPVAGFHLQASRLRRAPGAGPHCRGDERRAPTPSGRDGLAPPPTLAPASQRDRIRWRPPTGVLRVPLVRAPCAYFPETGLKPAGDGLSSMLRP